MFLVVTWKSKGVYNSKLKSLYTAFLRSIRFSEYIIVIQFDKDLLAIEQNNHESKNVNVYIVYDLDVWPKIPTINFKFKRCLFGATSVGKFSDKEKCVYSSYGIKFDSVGLLIFDNEIAGNITNFVVDNSFSSHVDYRKNNFFNARWKSNFSELIEDFIQQKKKIRKANTKV